jgi:CheY-like chemotaxis protein
MQFSGCNGSAIAAEPVCERRKPIPRRILLVDDEQSVREAIGLLLSLDDHVIIEAADGAGALDLFRRDHFDLVITDFEMPNMKGTELAATIKQLSPAQPILMITAYVERLSDSDSPVDAVLNKPFQLEDLRQTIANLLS